MANVLISSAALILALMISSEYSKREKKRLSELTAFRELLVYLRRRVGCLLSADISAFSDPALDALGFSSLAGRVGLSSAFLGIRERLSVNEKERELLSGIFASLGKSYLKDEKKLLDESVSTLTALLEKLSDEIPKKVKTAATLAATISVGIIIFLL